MTFLRILLTISGLCAALPALAASCASDQIDIRSNGALSRFYVEIADDFEERADGLMHREAMPRFAGMLFVYAEPQQVSFWMKNTLIPLDMVFIGPDGLVLRIHENAIPGDLTGIPSGNGVQYVLELNGGTVDMLGIQVGAQVRHPSIANDLAIWPCEG